MLICAFERGQKVSSKNGGGLEGVRSQLYVIGKAQRVGNGAMGHTSETIEGGFGGSDGARV